MALLRTLSKLRDSLSLHGDDRETVQLESARSTLFSLRETALAEARRIAVARDGEPPSIDLKDYYRAAGLVMQEANAALPEGATPYNIQQFGDLGGHTIKDFVFRQKDVEYLTSDDDPLGLNLQERGLELDLSGAHLQDVCFIPATTFNSLCNEEVANVTMNGVIFRGMGQEDELVLPRGTYRDISFAETQGGTLHLQQFAIVEQCNVRGATMHITMEAGAQLNELKSDAATSIITFCAEAGAIISNSSISEATIGLNSQLQGTIWRNVTLDNVNIAGVDFTGAQFNMVTINGQAISGGEGFVHLANMGVAAECMPSINGQTFADYQRLAETQRMPRREDFSANDPRREVLEIAANIFGNYGNTSQTATQIQRDYVPETAEARELRDARNAEAASQIATLNRILSQQTNGENA
ncbi:MAG: pentapeptide repeat-containing protein [Alphaproteobacteria bacterium]|nr:pentapeptide repeat-containing protein [Alphaproteobacteria bacterium]